MGNRLSRIYTRTGDDGTTGLADGSRVAKASARVEAYGTVDELNATLGLILAVAISPPVHETLTRIQHELFTLGGELATPGATVVTAAAGTGYLQRRPAATPGVYSARRRFSRCRLPSRTHRRAPGRATLKRTGRRRSDQRHRPALPQPPVGSAVCAVPGSGSCRCRGRNSVGEHTIGPYQEALTGTGHGTRNPLAVG